MDKVTDEKILAKIEDARSKYKAQDISFISQNCIGGVIYHDMGQKFLTPTINLYFMANDFIKFVENLEYYMNLEIVMKEDAEVVTGVLGDIEIYFLHYHTNEDAYSKWNERKARINYDKIFVIQTDRDGFDEESFKRFKNIKYPKALVTRNEKWKDEDFVIYIPRYKDEECVPDTIPEREFYIDNKIIDLINLV